MNVDQANEYAEFFLYIETSLGNIEFKTIFGDMGDHLWYKFHEVYKRSAAVFWSNIDRKHKIALLDYHYVMNKM